MDLCSRFQAYLALSSTVFTPLSTNFPAKQGVAKNNMACNIGETAAGPFLFIEAGKQGEAHELKNYIMVDNRGGP